MSGQTSYEQTPGDTEDDKANSRLCVSLRSFSRYSVGEVVPRVTAPSQTVAPVQPAKSPAGAAEFIGTIYFTSDSTIRSMSVALAVVLVTVVLALLVS